MMNLMRGERKRILGNSTWVHVDPTTTPSRWNSYFSLKPKVHKPQVNKTVIDPDREWGNSVRQILKKYHNNNNKVIEKTYDMNYTELISNDEELHELSYLGTYAMTLLSYMLNKTIVFVDIEDNKMYFVGRDIYEKESPLENSKMPGAQEGELLQTSALSPIRMGLFSYYPGASKIIYLFYVTVNILNHLYLMMKQKWFHLTKKH